MKRMEGWYGLSTLVKGLESVFICVICVISLI